MKKSIVSSVLISKSHPGIAFHESLILSTFLGILLFTSKKVIEKVSYHRLLVSRGFLYFEIVRRWWLIEISDSHWVCVGFDRHVGTIDEVVEVEGPMDRCVCKSL